MERIIYCRNMSDGSNSEGEKLQPPGWSNKTVNAPMVKPMSESDKRMWSNGVESPTQIAPEKKPSMLKRALIGAAAIFVGHQVIPQADLTPVKDALSTGKAAVGDTFERVGQGASRTIDKALNIPDIQKQQGAVSQNAQYHNFEAQGIEQGLNKKPQIEDTNVKVNPQDNNNSMRDPIIPTEPVKGT